VSNNIMKNAMNYGVSKYIRNDSETEQTLQANPYALKKFEKDLDDQQIPFAATIFQPTPGSTLNSPGALDSEIGKLDQANRDTYAQFTQWTNTNKIQARSKDGKPVSPYSPGARFFDANGVERTSEAQRFIDSQKQAAEASRQLEEKKQATMRRVGFSVTPQLRQQAEKAYQDAYNDVGASGGTGGGAAVYSEETRRKNAQNAYDAVLQNSPGYARYKKALEEDSKSSAVPIGISQFTSKKLNEGITEMFNNLAVNLDKDGLEFGMLGLQWGSGKNAGSDLKAEDYEKLKGKASYVGAGIDSDGKYKQFFKVGTSRTNEKGETVGEDIIVKMPAFTGVAANLVKEGHVTPAQQYIAQQIGSVTNDFNSTTIPLGDNLSVKVRKVLPSQKGYVENHSGVNYVVSYPGADGRVKEVATSSVDEATQNILTALQNQVKPK
jgi:hypothetical protein